MKTISASKFKATCLALMDEVQRTGETIVVTKRGRPIAKFVPVADETNPWRELGRLRGSAKITGDITTPIGTVDEWEWEW